YEITAVSDGKSCVEAVIQNKPDLILLDVMMPEIDGY
ncbi:MAG: response regulator, partial [Spirochaetes bacterium]|nr:response regulator [Spirochaetota bacterium]